MYYLARWSPCAYMEFLRAVIMETVVIAPWGTGGWQAGKNYGNANEHFLQASPWVTHAVIQMTPNNNLSSGLNTNLSLCPELPFVTCLGHHVQPSLIGVAAASTLGWVTQFPARNCCGATERKTLIFISMKIKSSWRPPFPALPAAPAKHSCSPYHWHCHAKGGQTHAGGD